MKSSRSAFTEAEQRLMNQIEELRNQRHIEKAEFYAQAGIDFVMGKREGIFIWDLDGKRLINCHSNGGVFNLGHRNPRDPTFSGAGRWAFQTGSSGHVHFTHVRPGPAAAPWDVQWLVSS